MNYVPYTPNKFQWGVANIITDKELFNEIADAAFLFGTSSFTYNGHLSKKGLQTGGAVWSDLTSKTSLEFLFSYRARIYRFVFRATVEKEEHEEIMSGVDALKIMRLECKEELKPFALRNNASVQEIKDKIPKYQINLTPFGQMLVDKELENTFHIDINSAFPAGVVANYPQFRPFFEKHYKLRHTAPIHKAIMNYAIGAAQSIKIRGNRYPELARAGIEWTNSKLAELTIKLKKAGYMVLGYNTDGIFVMKKNKMQLLYSDEDEGTELGQWKISHVFDKLRFKSAGSYEYIENRVYHPVVRGLTTLDKIKSRDKWEWGDIYQGKEIRYLLNINTNQIEEVTYG